MKDSVSELSNVSTSIGSYFSTMLDQSMSWDDAEKLASDWGKDFALKGVVSVEDAKRAVDIGCTGIVVSNHGGRQLDGQVANFDVLTDIVDAVGGWKTFGVDHGYGNGYPLQVLDRWMNKI